jgi:drug/metabolite transporter (DMT)-like permease
VPQSQAIELGTRALIGDAMAFGGALGITAYLLLGRAARREVPAVTYSALVFGWAALLLLPVCLLTGAPLTGYEPVTWLALGGIVFGPQLLGHAVFNTVLSTVPATVVAIAVLAEPVGAGLLAWWLLHELPATAFYLGAPLVLIGVAIATARRRGGPAPATRATTSSR